MNEVLNLLQSKFYPLLVEQTEEGYKIIACTGKFYCSLLIRLELLFSGADIDKIVENLKSQLHYDIEKQMFAKRYGEVKINPRGKAIMVDTQCPQDYNIMVCHPTKYAELLRDSI
jgi:hypothetical protein